jgi:serine/threonine protein phosphatase PrpC
MQLLAMQFPGVALSGRSLPQQDAMLIAAAAMQPLSADWQLWQQDHDFQHIAGSDDALKPLLLAVADGVSASPAAALASRTILSHLARLWLDGQHKGNGLSSRLLRACQVQLAETLGRKSGSFGASSTLAVLELHGNKFRAINVGDSRIWRFRDGALTQLSTDHCYAAELQPRSSVPLAQCYQALTSYLAADPDAEDFVVTAMDGDVRAGDQFLLSTDGIHDELSAELLAECCSCRQPMDIAHKISSLLPLESLSDNASLLWIAI